MSPDASVHEEQMEEIKEQRKLRDRGRRRARRSRNKSCCCAVGCMIPILGVVVLVGYFLLYFDFNVDNYFRPGGDEQIQKQTTDSEEDQKTGFISQSRSLAEDVKDRIGMLAEPGAMEMRLNELRGMVKSDSEASSLTLKSQLENATEQLEALRELAREKGEKAPEVIEKMKSLSEKIGVLEGALNEDGPTSETHSSDDLKGDM